MFVGVGDIASNNTTDDETVADLMASVTAGLTTPIFTTGDNVYPNGLLSEFQNYYDLGWGQFNSKIRPVTGNHDWGLGVTNNLDGYYGYFGVADITSTAPGGTCTDLDRSGCRSYYSYDIDADWHVVNLDSECALVGGCNAGSPQEVWLAADLAANADKNVIAIWHKPRFGSGSTGASGVMSIMDDLIEDLYQAGVDITLAGHDHIYERLAPINAAGVADPAYGMRHFTVGTGGESHHPLSTTFPASQVRNNDTFGVMKFTLHADSYEWEFIPAPGLGTFTDSGSDVVHDAPPPPVAQEALDLGTNSAYVTFGDPAKLDLAQFTIETWFKRTGAGTGGTTGGGGISSFIPMVTHGAPEADYTNQDANWLLGIDASTGTLAADFEDSVTASPNNNNHPIYGTTVVNLDEWHHAAATYDGATWNLYLDGNLENSLFVNLPTRSDTTQLAALGAMIKSPTQPGVVTGRFAGVLDEVRVWDSALSQSAIQANVNQQLSSSPGLVARWALDDSTGTAVADSVALEAEGTVTGTGWSWGPGAPYDIVIVPNNAPDVPTLVAPANGATDVAAPPALEVGVSDPDGGSLTTTFYGREVGAPAGEEFTIVVLPDTQHYVDVDAARRAVLHRADAVDRRAGVAAPARLEHRLRQPPRRHHRDTSTRPRSSGNAPTRRWTSSTTPAFRNAVSPGNHDLSTAATRRRTSSTSTSRPVRYDLPANPWYEGWLGQEAGQIDRMNKDNYELFTAGGIDFLIIHLEVDVPDYALNWAAEIIGRYPERQTIISTHQYLGASGTYSGKATTRSDGNTGQQIWDKLIKTNCSIFLVVNGHSPGENRRTDNNNCGQPVLQIVTDYQDRANGGDGWLRYYTFKPATNQIDACTFNTHTGAFETDSNSQFTLTYAMADVAGFTEIGSTITASGTNASTPWNGLASNTEYEWFAVVDDGTTAVQSDTWSFTTGDVPNWTAYVDLRSSAAIPTLPMCSSFSAQRTRTPPRLPVLRSILRPSSISSTLPLARRWMRPSRWTTAGSTSFRTTAATSRAALDSMCSMGSSTPQVSIRTTTPPMCGRSTSRGLDPSKRYEVVASSNRTDATDRAPPVERWTEVELLGADSAVRRRPVERPPWCPRHWCASRRRTTPFVATSLAGSRSIQARTARSV